MYVQLSIHFLRQHQCGDHELLSACEGSTLPDRASPCTGVPDALRGERAAVWTDRGVEWRVLHAHGRTCLSAQAARTVTGNGAALVHQPSVYARTESRAHAASPTLGEIGVGRVPRRAWRNSRRRALLFLGTCSKGTVLLTGVSVEFLWEPPEGLPRSAWARHRRLPAPSCRPAPPVHNCLQHNASPPGTCCAGTA